MGRNQESRINRSHKRPTDTIPTSPSGKIRRRAVVLSPLIIMPMFRRRNLSENDCCSCVRAYPVT
ncbi:TPA: hypothetical protein EYP37_08950, partial [Candidatus Poribacteria bacterium]|nr:hypothetical protein [Candidatus Poribacteria bacterium]